VPQDDTCPWNFVLGDKSGREIDFHVIVIDDNGNGIYGPPEKGQMYPAGALVGLGRINQHTVKCIAPEYMVKFHTGYKLRESDYQDIGALCKKFGIALPEEYTRKITS
jgi:lincosamide nucleotidyltransferase A/C/D/E